MDLQRSFASRLSDHHQLVHHQGFIEYYYTVCTGEQFRREYPQGSFGEVKRTDASPALSQ
jgi:hypothetical protein